jgi:mRNA-degrading endonuclease RelE of RelBE toxin-antitoxin system
MSQVMNKLRVPEEVADLIRGTHPAIKKKVKASLKTIMQDPYSEKALKEELAGLWSFRVSRFRIIYKIVTKEIQIVAIGPRSKIYQETYRKLSKSE